MRAAMHRPVKCVEFWRCVENRFKKYLLINGNRGSRPSLVATKPHWMDTARCRVADRDRQFRAAPPSVTDGDASLTTPLKIYKLANGVSKCQKSSLLEWRARHPQSLAAPTHEWLQCACSPFFACWSSPAHRLPMRGPRKTAIGCVTPSGSYAGAPHTSTQGPTNQEIWL